MRHRKARKKLTPTSSQHKGLMLSLLKALFKYEQVKTTRVRGKELKKTAERLITVARKDNVNSRRRVFKILRDKKSTKNLFTIAPRFLERKGGYTQAIKLGRRTGDSAPLVLIKLIK